MYDIGSFIGSSLGAIMSALSMGMEYRQNRENMRLQAEQNLRDYEWQRYVQENTWQREDNAVQRRMADLEAAGLNPNLAAGSAAGAGAVVGRSSSPAVQSRMDYSGLTDFVNSVLQIKVQEQEIKNLKKEFESKQEDVTSKSLSNAYDALMLNSMLGLDTSFEWRNDKNSNFPHPYFTLEKLEENLPLDGRFGRM